MSASPAPQRLDLEQVGLTLQALIEQSGREVTTLDQATGVIETISPELAAEPSGMLPMFALAAETVWRDATGKGFFVKLEPDKDALLGHRLEAVSGALSMMEAIEQVASPRELPCFEMLQRWHETTDRLARDGVPAGSRAAVAATAAAPGAGR
ncbi:MAG: hypothetical protein ACRYG8_49685 [Janthinobacterium lividum]